MRRVISCVLAAALLIAIGGLATGEFPLVDAPGGQQAAGASTSRPEGVPPIDATGATPPASLSALREVRETYLRHIPCLALPGTSAGIADILQRGHEADATPSERANARLVAERTHGCHATSRETALAAAADALDLGDPKGAVLAFHELLAARLRGLPEPSPEETLLGIQLLGRAALEYRDPRAFAGLADLHGDGHLVPRSPAMEYSYRLLFESSGAADVMSQGGFPVATDNLLRIDALEAMLAEDTRRQAQERAATLHAQCCEE